MQIEPVPSALPDWKPLPPPRTVFSYGPGLDPAVLRALQDDGCLLVPREPGSRGFPIYIPGPPVPTEAHFAELVTMNPGLGRVHWGSA